MSPKQSFSGADPLRTHTTLSLPEVQNLEMRDFSSGRCCSDNRLHVRQTRWCPAHAKGAGELQCHET